MIKFIPFPKVRNFNETVEDLIFEERFIGLSDKGEPQYDNEKKLPSLHALGHAQLNGKQVAVGFFGDEIWFQNKDEIITLENDSYGFVDAMLREDRLEHLKKVNQVQREDNGIDDDCAIILYGEWCGEDITLPEFAISALPKMLVIFAIRCVNMKPKKYYSKFYEWLPLMEVRNEYLNIHESHDCDNYELYIDLENLEETINEIQDEVKYVLEKCPFAKEFGVYGVGEGIVWTFEHMGKTHRIKSKGK